MDVTHISSATLRAYNVGFGDCLLLSIGYSDGDSRHVLIDFGSTKLPTAAGPLRMTEVAENIRDVTGNKLHVVVATHRHADHISGFGGAQSGPIIEALDPDVVVQPWTEDPLLDPKGGKHVTAAHPGGHLALARTLTNMNAFAAGAAFEGRRLQRSVGFPKTVAARVEFLGETNIKNRAAVERLMKMGKRHVYASYGDDLGVAALLPDVHIEVLGPPTLAQAPSIAREAQKDAAEFWHLAGLWGAAAVDGQATIDDLLPMFPEHVLKTIPQAAKWLVPQIERAHADEMLSILRILDGVLNNTSLILLIRIGDTTLLFPGDAQIENWSYALFDAPDHERVRKLLANTGVYKVGHHGSLNATPKTLWNGFRMKGDETQHDRLISVVSTLAGKHGDTRRDTEVPRETLVTALKANSSFHSTQNCRGNTKFWVDVDIPLTM